MARNGKNGGRKRNRDAKRKDGVVKLTFKEAFAGTQQLKVKVKDADNVECSEMISTYDNGPEFCGAEFQEMLASAGIKSARTTVKNPQAQSLIERMHLTLGDQFRTTILAGDNWLDDLERLVQACAWAIRATVPSNCPYSPAELAFGADMVFRQRVHVDWQHLKELRQKQAAANNEKENRTRLEHTYKVGDKVLIVLKPYERQKNAKLSSPTVDEKPYTVTKVYAGSKAGTVRIDRGGFEEDISIRRLQPYIERK